MELKEKLLTSFELDLGVQLPEDYRTFLRSHSGEWMEDEIIVEGESISMPLERLLTIEDLHENNENQCIGIPEMGLMFIGESLMTCYLYMNVRDKDFGQLYVGDSTKVEPTKLTITELLASNRIKKKT